MRPSIRTVLEGLAAEDLFPRDSEVKARGALIRARRAQPPPWFVRVLIGGGAWVTMLLFLLALLLAGFHKSTEGMGVLGVVLVAGATALRWNGTGDFLVQLTLSAAFTGEGLILFAMSPRTEMAMALSLVVVELPVLFLFRDVSHRFLSTVGILGALGTAAMKAGGPGMLAMYVVVLAVVAYAVWLDAPRLLQRGTSVFTPVAYGMVVSLLLAMGACLMLRGEWHTSADSKVMLGFPVTAAVGLALLYFEWRIFTEQGVPLGSEAAWATFLGTVLLGVVTFNTPGILAAIGVLVLAFHRREVLLAGLAAAFLVGFGVFFYYDLAVSLMVKSLVLVASGVLVLLARWYLRARWLPPEVSR